MNEFVDGLKILLPYGSPGSNPGSGVAVQRFLTAFDHRFWPKKRTARRPSADIAESGDPDYGVYQIGAV